MSLLLGPLVAMLMIANSFGIMAVSLPVPAFAAAACPTDASAVTSMSVEITRGASTINSANLGSVNPGDKVKVIFDLDNDCASYPVSLVSYKAAAATYDASTVGLRQVFSQKTQSFGASGGSLEVTVPSCFHATVFAVGNVITTMSPSALYGAKQVSAKEGGSTACPGISPPANAPTYIAGNPTCASIGSSTFGESWSEYKIDSTPSNQTYSMGNGGTVTITGATSNQFNWSSNKTLRAVYVKASTGGNLFAYPGGGASGTGLYSPSSPTSGNRYDISHVSFCYVPAATGTTPTAVPCPNDKSAVSSYRFEIVRGGVTTNATDLNGVRSGDLVKVYFDLKSGCTGIRLSISSYETVEPYWNINTAAQQRYIPYTGDTGLFSASMSASQRMVQTVIPGCYFQSDFVWGAIIPNLSPTNLYGSNKFAWKNGGSPACSWSLAPTPTPTNTPVPPTATNTNTPVPPTNTPTATPTKTSTPVPPTSTPVPPTSTPVPPTATPVPPTATPVPSTLLIHKRTDLGAALGDACFEVYGGAGYDEVICDDGSDPLDADIGIAGEVRLTYMVPGYYEVVEISAPDGYVLDQTAHGVTVPVGGFGETTIVNQPEVVGGTSVVIHKLNCESNPGPVDPIAVANGNLPAGCVRAPAGVAFDIIDQNGVAIYTGTTTNGSGRLTVTIALSVERITLIEYPNTNPLVQPPPAPGFVFTDIHCPCGHTDLVVVNILKPRP